MTVAIARHIAEIQAQYYLAKALEPVANRIIKASGGSVRV